MNAFTHRKLVTTKDALIISPREIRVLEKGVLFQGRDTTSARKLESAAIQLEEKAHSKLESDEKTTFPQAEAYEERLLQQIAGILELSSHGLIFESNVSRCRILVKPGI